MVFDFGLRVNVSPSLSIKKHLDFKDSCLLLFPIEEQRDFLGFNMVEIDDTFTNDVLLSFSKLVTDPEMSNSFVLDFK